MNSVECLDLSQENGNWQPVAPLTYRRGKSDIFKIKKILFISIF
jgi:hypothetical protein